MGINLVGTGMSVPKKCLTNEDLEKIVDTNDQWITERTGIKTRYIAKDETMVELMINATKMAMENAKVDTVDVIIVATLQSDYILHNAACSIRKELNLQGDIPAFDINSACSGFIYGTWVAENILRNGVYKRILVVGADFLSRITDWTDRSTCVLFGDGVGAAIYEMKDNDGDILAVTVSGTNDHNNVLTCENKVYMNGPEVFKFATKQMVKKYEELSAMSGIAINDISYFVPHQANKRIIDYAAKKLKIDEKKIVVNVDKYGNTSAASVPMALHELMVSGNVKPGDTVGCVAFGGGLSSGGFLFRV